jgi:hypothetical protein
MAKCDLSIELDDPKTVHQGGGKISGVVRVVVDADVKCTGLEVTSGWKTHGRGNVASDDAGKATLFTGEWRAGENAEYRFELPIADWPPTYHGHYLNIDHYVAARARVPWGFDPKAATPFIMRPSCGPEGATVPKKVTEVKGILGCIVGIVILGFVGGILAAIVAAGPFSLFFLLLPLGGFGFWFFRVFLPKYLLGEVQYQLSPETVSPGDSVTGELTIRPRKNVPINCVTLHFQAREQCVSGSGSNRTTHKNVFFEKLETLQEATTLRSGNEHRFPLSVKLPEDAPHSVDLDDNDLIWSATLRVDIPRWPDWVKEIPLLVVPSGKPVEIQASEPEQFSPPAVTASKQVGPTDGGITFAETASHLWGLRDDREQVETLVEAVSGLTFNLEAVIQRRLLYGGDDDPHVYKDGYAVWARFTDPKLPLVLYVPHELADEFEQAGREVWTGRGTVVGWDSLHGRLQIKLPRPQ